MKIYSVENSASNYIQTQTEDRSMLPQSAEDTKPTTTLQDDILNEIDIPKEKAVLKSSTIPVKSEKKEVLRKLPAIRTKTVAKNNSNVSLTAMNPLRTGIGINGQKATGQNRSERVKVVARTKPNYPDRAKLMGIEGRVSVRFDVDIDGKVSNVRILSETPKNVFTKSVQQAIHSWRYEKKKPTRNMESVIIFQISQGVRVS